MSDAALYPLLLQPALHVKVWGGRKLETVLHKPLPSGQPYGEAWELHDTATVSNGPLAGRTIGDLVRDYGSDLIGPGSDPAHGFPLLVKFLDASQWLSVQVHPNDAQARQFDGEVRGKTEAWYVIQAEPGSKLVIGLQPGTSRETLASAIRENRLEPLLIAAEVVPGDVLFVAPGTVHALGPGILIYEIQQSSDLTYRLYDWGRMDLNGQPRALHIDKGLAVANLDRLPEIVHTGASTDEAVTIAECDYFKTELYQFMDGRIMTFADFAGHRFDALTCIEGRAVIDCNGLQVVMETGQTVLVPAAIERFELMGRARVLRSTPAVP